MILSMSYQVKLFLFTVGIGAFLGLICDIFRIFRKIFKHTNLITNIEDAIYWLFVTFVMFYLMLNKNYAEIRFFTIIGTFTGMILYFATISRFIIITGVFVIKLVIKIILVPLRLIFYILKIPVLLTFKIIKKLLFPVKKLLQKLKKYAKIKSNRLRRELRIIRKKF